MIKSAHKKNNFILTTQAILIKTEFHNYGKENLIGCENLKSWSEKLKR